ncbi:winged helix-turn-helix domain-containing protein [Allokutzneria albata]|uniref:Helix-turn-helix domain-containing protein n=1 Tax=Allokutzneria albata TaxID=211114 RepID=A0A1G9RXI5_ALLAB|nr:winged helix-turn-helix domain-containing protein [Allokutzneria albata]SDM27737.1 Helix-turn-helix domain-containing protein [Allokutzneria albata]
MTDRLRERREITADEAKAMAHPLRLRILRLCRQREMTNKQLAERLGRDPGTVLHHVRHLVRAGFLEQAPVRTGESGALEKPYRVAMNTWYLSTPPNAVPGTAQAPIAAFQEELAEAGPDSVRTFARFMLHLSQEQLEELDRRICAVIDSYVDTDGERLDQPALGGIFVMHRLAE